jgi:hypothetical protein
MNITNDVKHTLIHSMLRQASKRQAASTTKAARALDKLWRQLFAKQIALKIPEVPEARWAPLIQDGIFNSLKGKVHLVTVKLNDKFNATQSEVIGKVGYTYETLNGNIQVREKDKEKWQTIRQAVEEEWGAFLNFTEKYTGSYDFHYSWKTSHADLPSIPGLDKVFHPDVTVGKADEYRIPYSTAAYRLVQESERLLQAYMAVIIAAGALYEDLVKILAPIRTLKHLEAQFPDAVQYLPEGFTEKVKNVKQLADPKLVSRASALLLTGIPD